MKRFLILAALPLAIYSCGKDNGTEDNTPKTKNYKVSGLVEKGPFVSGSTVNFQPLDNDYAPVGTNYHASITDNNGTFNLGELSLTAPYATMSANGYFFNEVTGELSKGTLSLNAMVDLTNKSSVNVNLLTHLKYFRVQHLLGLGVNFKEADAQAQEELFKAFGLQKHNTGDVSQYSISGGTDQSAALIAISSLLIVDRSEAQLTEYLANLSKDFGENGYFSVATKEVMGGDLAKLLDKLGDIRNNIIRRYQELGKEVTVKDLYGFYDWDGDGEADGGTYPIFKVTARKQTSYGYELTFETNRSWEVVGKPSWITVTPDSGDASESAQTIAVQYDVTDPSQIGETGMIDIEYAGNVEAIGITRQPYPKHADKRVLLLYSAGNNSLSQTLAADMDRFCEGYLPSNDDGADVVLVFSKQPATVRDYSTPTKPTLTRVYRSDEGAIVKEVIKEWEAGTPACTKETMQSVLTYVSSTFPGYSCGMVFSSHATGWLPVQYYANPGAFGDDYIGGYSFSVARPKSIGQDVNGDGTYTEMTLKEFAEAIPFKLDYLIFDCVYMGGIEVAYELRNKCNYLVASPTEVMMEGLAYGLLTFRLLCPESPDLTGVCTDYMAQYAAYSGASNSATIAAINSSKIDDLASACKNVFQSAPEAFKKVDVASVQTFNRQGNRPFFFDMADIFRAAYGSSSQEYSTVSRAIEDAVIYKASTQRFIEISINTFCGLSMFIPNQGKDYLVNYYKDNIAWCKDTAMPID